MKRIKIILILIIVFLTGCTNQKKSEDLKITVTSFPCYDITRSVVGDDSKIEMLIKPGTEVHTYEPTPQDIINISKSDIFIYVGGSSDEWVEDVLKSVENKDLKVIKLIDYVDVLEDSEHEHHHDVDEHIWTNPLNIIKMANIINTTVSEVDSENKDKYLKNTNNYVLKLNELDHKYRELVNNAKRKNVVFADRFPFKYLALEYGLDYKAAYHSCSAEAEVSAKTLKELVDYVNENDINTVFYLELSNEKIADTIIEETGCSKKLFHSGQNVTAKDFENGITLIEIMENNLSNLEGALN